MKAGGVALLLVLAVLVWPVRDRIGRAASVLTGAPGGDSLTPSSGAEPEGLAALAGPGPVSLRAIWHEDPVEIVRRWRMRRNPDDVLAAALALLDATEPALVAGLPPATAISLAVDALGAGNGVGAVGVGPGAGVAAVTQVGAVSAGGGGGAGAATGAVTEIGEVSAVGALSAAGAVGAGDPVAFGGRRADSMAKARTAPGLRDAGTRADGATHGTSRDRPLGASSSASSGGTVRERGRDHNNRTEVVTARRLGAALAESARQGRSVAGVWADYAERTGSRDLAFVAAAWRLSEDTGVPLALAVARAASGLREARTRQRKVAIAVAGPRATVAVLTVLPLTGPLFGLACGIGPAELYGERPIGALSAVGGVLLMALGRFWCRRMIRRAVTP